MGGKKYMRDLLYFPSFFLLYLQGKLKVHEEHTSASLNPKYGSKIYLYFREISRFGEEEREKYVGGNGLVTENSCRGTEVTLPSSTLGLSHVHP